ncbi:MAG: hypothetical protein U9R66_13860 [Thermodesulfobacteriota bacterium]|nr:hypothetical protein [Thermodesulfobacteriota bacterium]
MEQNTKKRLFLIFAELSKAAARKKIYAQKAAQEGRKDVAHFLRAAAESETIQVRRIFNNMKGQIDKSPDYLTTIFEQEVTSMIEVYEDYIQEAKGQEPPPVITALSQLLQSELIIASFYSSENKDLSIGRDDHYFVCPFCGCLMEGEPPEQCPVCGADRKTFREVA